MKGCVNSDPAGSQHLRIGFRGSGVSIQTLNWLTCTSSMELRTITGTPLCVYTRNVSANHIFLSRCVAECSSSMMGPAHITLMTSTNTQTLHLESIGYVVVVRLIGLLDRLTCHVWTSSAGVKWRHWCMRPLLIQLKTPSLGSQQLPRRSEIC
ncbi:hypothetical protein AVEN_19145-1 [Araneus ventricosus]|uniref:Uncharacterized protein n=1 Tax=Araneus ventricosus TaxID=182803 RepID=A0A4Y2SA20_ARAVE|nr:hypothetical protein AVEN_19145-1 [Araneus ventricosus]